MDNKVGVKNRIVALITFIVLGVIFLVFMFPFSLEIGRAHV